jgi:glycerate kinase
MKFAEKCLRGLARGVKELCGKDLSRNPGMGAAGGLGFGLHAFLGARMEPGFDLFARYAKLDEVLRNADLVVTGEGSLDASSLMGKGVGQLATLARSLAIPCIGLAGHVAAEVERDGRFFSAIGLDSITDRESAMRQPAHWLTSAAQLAAQIPIPHPSSRP